MTLAQTPPSARTPPPKQPEIDLEAQMPTLRDIMNAQMRSAAAEHTMQFQKKAFEAARQSHTEALMARESLLDQLCAAAKDPDLFNSNESPHDAGT